MTGSHRRKDALPKPGEHRTHTLPLAEGIAPEQAAQTTLKDLLSTHSATPRAPSASAGHRPGDATPTPQRSSTSSLSAVTAAQVMGAGREAMHPDDSPHPASPAPRTHLPLRPTTPRPSWSSMGVPLVGPRGRRTSRTHSAVAVWVREVRSSAEGRGAETHRKDSANRRHPAHAFFQNLKSSVIGVGCPKR